MIDDLRTEKIDGLVLPSDLTNYYITQYCDLQDLKDLINEYDYGIVFPIGLDKSISGNISQAIVKMTETYRYLSYFMFKDLKEYNFLRINILQNCQTQIVGMRKVLVYQNLLGYGLC